MGGVGPNSCAANSVSLGGGASAVRGIVAAWTRLVGSGVGGLYRPVPAIVVFTVVMSAERGDR